MRDKFAVWMVDGLVFLIGLLTLTATLGIWLWTVEVLVIESIKPGMSWRQVGGGVGFLLCSSFMYFLAQRNTK